MGEEGGKIKLRSVENMICIHSFNRDRTRHWCSYFQVQAALELAEEAEGDMEEYTMLMEEV